MLIGLNISERAHLDGDIIAYRCAAANKDEDVNIACWQAGEMVQRILHETNALSYNCFLTGGGNFRFDVYPDYKGNRKDVPKPKHLAAIREYLVVKWNAKVSDGCEADDLMGVEQCAEPEGSVICTIDKDLLMIPGLHYNFVKKEFQTVSPLQGLRHFYWQLIMGDKTDNIPGYDGKMRQKVPQFLYPVMEKLEAMTEEKDMLELVRGMYSYDDERLTLSAKCLWIWRKDNDIWSWPIEKDNGVDGSEDESFHYFGTSSL